MAKLRFDAHSLARMLQLEERGLVIVGVSFGPYNDYEGPAEVIFEIDGEGMEGVDQVTAIYEGSRAFRLKELG